MNIANKIKKIYCIANVAIAATGFASAQSISIQVLEHAMPQIETTVKKDMKVGLYHFTFDKNQSNIFVYRKENNAGHFFTKIKSHIKNRISILNNNWNNYYSPLVAGDPNNNHAPRHFDLCLEKFLFKSEEKILKRIEHYENVIATLKNAGLFSNQHIYEILEYGINSYQEPKWLKFYCAPKSSPTGTVFVLSFADRTFNSIFDKDN